MNPKGSICAQDPMRYRLLMQNSGTTQTMPSIKRAKNSCENAPGRPADPKSVDDNTAKEIMHQHCAMETNDLLFHEPA